MSPQCLCSGSGGLAYLKGLTVLTSRSVRGPDEYTPVWYRYAVSHLPPADPWVLGHHLLNVREGASPYGSLAVQQVGAGAQLQGRWEKLGPGSNGRVLRCVPGV